MTTPALPNLKLLPFGGAGAVDSPELHELVRKYTVESVGALDDATVHQRFVEQYVQWIKASKLNTLNGIDAFPIAAFSNGTTEAFDKFYLKNNQRRFRCFRGEYMYHAGTWKNYHQWSYMDQDDLRENDALVLSLPFSDSGNIHPATEQTLDRCFELGIPVLIDCAFFGLCAKINFNLDHLAITDLTFSLSKAFPVANLRIGMRLTRVDDDDSLLIYNKTNYVNRLGASVGLKVLNSMTADTNWTRWHTVQEQFCQELNVKPSKTVIFGLAEGDAFKEYNRGGSGNRLCFYRRLANGSLK